MCMRTVTYVHEDSCIYLTYNRHWNHIQAVSDTDGTDDDELTGGLGKYSHGDIGLSHQHWVEQVISGGSFGVHCTEAAEAKHKTCMSLSSHRVRHLRQNLTQISMLRYLCWNSLFQDMMKSQPQQYDRPLHTEGKQQILLPLQLVTPGGVSILNMGDNLHETEQQQRFLHPEVRLARVELMDLMCVRLGLPKSRSSYRLLNRLDWKFGQKFITTSNTTYWATDSRYSCSTSENQCQRRDILLLRGTERIPVKIHDGRVVMKPTALCCQAICFLSVDNIHTIEANLHPNVIREINDSELIYLIIETHT